MAGNHEAQPAGRQQQKGSQPGAFRKGFFLQFPLRAAQETEQQRKAKNVHAADRRQQQPRCLRLGVLPVNGTVKRLIVPGLGRVAVRHAVHLFQRNIPEIRFADGLAAVAAQAHKHVHAVLILARAPIERNAPPFPG